MSSNITESISITNHARNRWVQRIANKDERRYQYQKFTLDSMIADDIKMGKENRSIYNNHSFIAYIIDRHGPYNFRFWVSDRAVYIYREIEGTNLVITCYSVDSTHLVHLKKGPRY